MKVSTTVSAALFTLAALPIGHALGQTSFEFTLDPAASGFAWSGSTNQGALTGDSRSFDLEGSLTIDLWSDVQGLRRGQFGGAAASIEPGIVGEFAGGPPNTFLVDGALLDFVSDSFAIADDGSFTATLAPSFLDGEIQMAPPHGPGGFLFLDGRVLQPVVVDGFLTPAASGLRLVAPVVLVFDFSLGGVSGSLTMSGQLAAEFGCSSRSYCTASPNSAGPGAVISTVGTPSVSFNRLLLRVAGLPPHQIGFFLYGASPVQTPFGSGLLCIRPPLFHPALARSNAAGDATHLLDMSSPPRQGGQIVAGAAWSFQFLYRDSAGSGAHFNLSDAVRVVFCP